MRKSFLLLALGLLMAVGAQAKTYDLTTWSVGKEGHVLLLNSGDTLQGTMQEDVYVRVQEGATVFLNGLKIDHVSSQAPLTESPGIECYGHAVIHMVKGTVNEVHALNSSSPAVFVPEGKNLILEGKGSLNAYTRGYAAAIGAGYRRACGNITINNCFVFAQSITGYAMVDNGRASVGGAGIGASCRNKCGNITITNAEVWAYGGAGAAGIGGGGFDYTGSGALGSCGRIQIDGADVTAFGGYHAPGIGSGIDNSCTKISVSMDTKVLLAYPGEDWNMAVGHGKNGKCGYINIGGELIEQDDPVLDANPFTYPSCLTPTDVNVYNVTTTTAIVNWIPVLEFMPGEALEKHWEVKYAKHYGGLGAQSKVVNKHPIELYDLVPGTAYDVWVRSKCSEMDYSDWTPAYTFTTKEAPNECTTPENLTASNVTYNSATITWTPGEGEYAQYKYELYYRRADNYTYYETQTTDKTSFTFTNLEPETEYVVWIKGYCSGLSKGSDESAKIRFTTEAKPTCPLPTHVAISELEQNSALLSWDSNDNWSGIRIKWKKMSGDGDHITEELPTNTLAYRMTDLEPGTPYVAYITGICDNIKESVYMACYFTTKAKPAEQPQPTGLYTTYIEAQSAFAVWDLYQDFGYVQVSYKKSSESTWSDPVTPGKNMYYIQLTDLEPETEYDVRIRGSQYTTSGLQSEWVQTSFTTLKKKQSCQAPSGFLKYSNPDFYSQALIWRVIEGQNEWLVSYKADGETTYQVREVTLDDVEIIQSNGYDYYKFILDNLSSNTRYMVRMCTICGDDESGNTDEYTFTTKTCGAPTELQCTYDKFSYSQILLWWQPATGTKKWLVAYREKGFDGAFLTQEADINSFSLENLAPDTEYEIYVVAECGEYNYSEASNTIYASTKACLAPTITLIDAIETSATISWEKNTNQPFDWDVQYREGSETYYPGGITYEASGSAAQYTATHLKPGTSYIAHVRCACDRDNYVFSDWSAEELFTTSGETGLEEISAKFDGSVKVLRDGQLFIMYNGTMYNVQGRRVN